MPESLEHKSVHGWTPLHLAVAVRRPEIVELLMAAGANQRARDKCGRNVIHIMAGSDPEILRKMISLFDKAHVKEMFLEKCNQGESFSQLAPLSYWMVKNAQNSDWNSINPDQKLEVIKVFAEHSQADDMELINGEGDLPLHQVRL